MKEVEAGGRASSRRDFNARVERDGAFRANLLQGFGVLQNAGNLIFVLKRGHSLADIRGAEYGVSDRRIREIQVQLLKRGRLESASYGSAKMQPRQRLHEQRGFRADSGRIIAVGIHTRAPTTTSTQVAGSHSSWRKAKALREDWRPPVMRSASTDSHTDPGAQCYDVGFSNQRMDLQFCFVVSSGRTSPGRTTSPLSLRVRSFLVRYFAV